VLRASDAPLYCTRTTAGRIDMKLEEHGLRSTTDIYTCKAGDVVQAGRFSVEFIHVNHSISDAVAFAIKCPVGVCVHTGDWKIDPTPISGGMIDLARFGELGKQGVLALLCDSTNVERSGFTKSERNVGDSFDSLFNGCTERIIITTFSSNIDRIQQIINVAARYGRKVAVSGRSMENALRVSRELGYMNVPDGVLVDLSQLKTLPKNKVCIITTGSQGETMSAMTRIAFSTHRQIEIQPGDRVIMSASAIPGNENAIGAVINELYRKGAEVVNERKLDLHVSGHACQQELSIMHALVQPKFFIPVHGEQRMMKLHAKLAQRMGMSPNNIIISEVGKVIELTKDSARINGTVPSGKVLVDGYGVGDVGSVVLRDRKHLAEDGVIVVVMTLSAESGELLSGPDIVTRGFVYVKESEALLSDLQSLASQVLYDCESRHITDWATIKSSVKGELSSFLYKKTKRNPMILPIIMDV
ncbi:MAG: ribonuclease J, partial [Clostridiales bacterium]|nr:ribonuclease J [Clostridiales bacterium]